MKDYKKQITYKSLNAFVEYASKEGYDIDVVEGVLNDTYIIYNEEKTLSVKGVRPRKFIILYPEFASSWHNNFMVLMTDKEDTMEEFLK